MSIGFSKKKVLVNYLVHIFKIGMNKIYIIKMVVTKMDFDSDLTALSTNQRLRKCQPIRA